MSVHNKLYINDSLYTGKVDDHVFTSPGWGHLSTVDQDLAKSDAPRFGGLKVGSSSDANVHIKYTGEVAYDFKLPSVAPANGKSLKMGESGLSWVDNAGFNQSLNTSNDVAFRKVEATGAASSFAALNADSLNASGEVKGASLYATNGLTVNGGSVNVDVGNLTLSAGDVTLTSGELKVLSGLTTLQAATATSLTVSGDTELAATTAASLTVSGATELATLDATNLDLSGTLDVVGLSTLATVSAGAVTASGLTVSTNGLTVSAGGLTVVAGDFTAGTSVTSKLKNTEIVGTLEVSGISELNVLKVKTGAFDVSLGLSTVKDLKVEGAATLDSSLSVTGASTLTGLVTASSGVTLSSGNLAVQSGNATVSGNASVGGTFGVTGISTLGVLDAGASTLASLTVAGNTTINGSLFVEGTTTSVNTTDMDVKDRIIVLNKGGADLISGGVAGDAPVGLEVDRGTKPNSALLYQEAVIPYWKVGTSSTYHRLLEALDDINAGHNGKIPVFDATGRLSASLGISKHAADQLKNMDSGSAISAGQWEYLSNLDQELSTTSDVSFNGLEVSNLTVDGDFILEPGTSLAESVSSELKSSSVISNGITIVSTVGSTVSLSLPSNSDAKGKTFTVYFKSRTGSFIVDILPNSTDTIEGGASFSLVQAGQHVRFTSLGYGNWIVN